MYISYRYTVKPDGGSTFTYIHPYMCIHMVCTHTSSEHNDFNTCISLSNVSVA